MENVLGEWLQELPSLFLHYSELPESVRKGHRQGVAEILQKLGGNQYGHLTEDKVIRGLSLGVSNAARYELLPDAFFTYDTNLRKDTLQSLFARVGIENAWGWIAGHGKVFRFLEDVRGQAGTVESELHNFIEYRNSAAHGDVDEIVSPEEVSRVADFVVTLCEVLAELIVKKVIDRCLTTGQATFVGSVIHSFGNNVIGVEVEAVPFASGDCLYVFRDHCCYEVNVESLEICGRPHERVESPKGTKVGFKLNKPAKDGSRLVRYIPLKAGQGGLAVGDVHVDPNAAKAVLADGVEAAVTPIPRLGDCSGNAEA